MVVEKYVLVTISFKAPTTKFNRRKSIVKMLGNIVKLIDGIVSNCRL